MKEELIIKVVKSKKGKRIWKIGGNKVKKEEKDKRMIEEKLNIGNIGERKLVDLVKEIKEEMKKIESERVKSRIDEKDMGVGRIDRLIVGLNSGNIERRKRIEMKGKWKIRIIDIIIEMEKKIVEKRKIFKMKDKSDEGMVDEKIGKKKNGKKEIKRRIDIRDGEGIERNYVDIIENSMRIEECIEKKLDKDEEGWIGKNERWKGEKRSKRRKKRKWNGERRRGEKEFRNWSNRI